MMANDAKLRLNTYVQKYIGRPVSNADITYTVATYGAQKQATAKLHCLGGTEYAGELALTDMDAEQNAATQAILGLQQELGPLPTEATAVHKAPMILSSPTPLAKQVPVAKAPLILSGPNVLSSPGGCGGAPQLVEAATAVPKRPSEPVILSAPTKKLKTGDSKSRNQKMELFHELQKIGLQPKKGDIEYVSQTTPSGEFMANVQIKCLPGIHAQQSWGGSICSTQHEAENNAAESAISALPSIGREMSSSALAVVPSGNVGGIVGGVVGGAQTPDLLLRNLLLAIKKAPLANDDIIYDCQECDGGFQSTLTIGIFPEYAAGSCTWAGEVKPTKEQAIQSAAHIVYNQLAADPKFREAAAQAASQGGLQSGALPAANKDEAQNQQQLLQMAAQFMTILAGQTQNVDNSGKPQFGQAAGQGGTGKVLLHNLLAKLLQREVTAKDVMYTNLEVTGGIQATIKVLAYDSCEWAGHVCPNQVLAEQSAAAVAYEALLQDPAVAALAASDALAPMAPRPRRPPGANTADKDPGKLRITPEPITGTVRKYRAPFGWIMPDTPIEHNGVKLKEDGLYVHKKECQDTDLVIGQKVKCHVYVDKHGLGAESVVF